MFSTVSNIPPANACKTLSYLVISSWNLLTNPDNLVQSCQGNAVVDSRKTRDKAIADFRVGSTNGSEAVLSSAENSKTSSNVSRQLAALTATCSSDHLDAEHSKYDTCDKISRQTMLSKSKKPETINSVALPYEDQMCNTDFKVKDDLVRHKKTHGIKCSFRCDICDREFCSAGNLRRHTQLHTNERPFRCKVCLDTFNRADYLLIHERTHTGERPFECTKCNKSFTRKPGLIAHMDTHNKTPHFKCDVCNNCFYRKQVLKNHMRTHDGIRPFKCDICAATFRTNSSFWSHKKRWHCDANSTSKTSNKHIKPENHTTNSETEFTTPGEVSTISQLPSVSNQPSTTGIHVNKSQNQKEYEDTSALLNEFINTYSITSKLGSCEHDDDLSLDLDMLEETFLDE